MPACTSRRERRTIDHDQVRAQRDFLWLDLATRSRGRWPTMLIAAVFRMERSTVHRGIERAREARGVIENAAVP